MDRCEQTFIDGFVSKLQTAGFAAPQARFLAVQALHDMCEKAGRADHAAELRRRFGITKRGR